MDIGEQQQQFYAEPPPRVLAVSMKDEHGEWQMVRAIELRLAHPVVLYSDTAGVVTISGGRLPEPPPASKP